MNVPNVLYDDLILIKIFSYFKIKKLHSLATVCKKWKEIVKELIAIHSMKPKVEITLFESGDWQFIPGTSGIRDVFIEKENFASAFKQSFNELSFEPNLFIYFLTDDFYVHKQKSKNESIIRSSSYLKDPSDDAETNRRKNVGYAAHTICELLPKRSLQLVIATEAFVFTDSKKYEGNKFEDPESYSALIQFINPNRLQPPPVNPAVGGILLPANPNFRFDLKQLINEEEFLADMRNEKDLLKFFDVKPDESLRMIMLFVNNFFAEENFMQKFLATLNKIRGKKIPGMHNITNLVVIGNCVNDAYTNVKEREYATENAEITFVTLMCKKSQQDSVRIAQMVVSSKGEDYYDEHYEENSTDSEDDEVIKNVIDLKLKLLKDTWAGNNDFNEKNTFGLLNMVPATMSEMIGPLLNVNFPKLPIFGCIGHEIYGHDFFPIDKIKITEPLERRPTKENKINYNTMIYEHGKHDCAVLTIISLN